MDKNVLFEIVKKDITNVNSLIRSCKKYKTWMYNNKQLMDFIAKHYIASLHTLSSHQLSRIFTHPNIKKIQYKREDYRDTIYILSTDGIILKSMSNLHEELKQPSVKDANEQLKKLTRQYEKTCEWIINPKYSDMYFLDALQNYAYIVTKSTETKSISEYIKNVSKNFTPELVNMVMCTTMITMSCSALYMAYHSK